MPSGITEESQRPPLSPRCFFNLTTEKCVQILLSLFFFTPWVCVAQHLAPSPNSDLISTLGMLSAPCISPGVSHHITFARGIASSWNFSPQVLPGGLILVLQLSV